MKTLLAMLLCLTTSSLFAQTFSELVGPVEPKPYHLTASKVVRIPYITWGGDVAEMHANGGLKTAPGSINAKLGLNIELTKGDDVLQQTRDYVNGTSPFFRGTIGMLGMASEVFGKNPQLKPHVLVQLTWSAGDHLVGPSGSVTSLNDLSKKKYRYALQQGGPHVNLMYEVMKLVPLNKDQVELVFCKDLSGPNGPAEMLRNGKADLAFVITPDMIGLTGGLKSVGSGAEGTVKGAKVVVSTQSMTRVIPDVWAVRSDWYEQNQDFCKKFVAGFLKASEEVVALRKQFNETNKLSPEYKKLLTTAQNAFGKEVIPSLEVDGHGLMSDALFVGLPGQISFFEDKGNLSGYEHCVKSALDMSQQWGYVKSRNGFTPPGLDYKAIAQLAGIAYQAPAKQSFAEEVNVFPDGDLDERTIVSFSINFEPNQEDFSTDQYGSEFNRVMQNASKFGNALIVIRGHSDPTKTLTDLIKVGLAKGILERRGIKPYKYFLEGRELTLEHTHEITKLIESGVFDNPPDGLDAPRETLSVAMNLSVSRAEAVKVAIQNYAKTQGVNLNLSQIKPTGAGVQEPLIPKPKNMEEARKNMRVEFRVVRRESEAGTSQDFEY